MTFKTAWEPLAGSQSLVLSHTHVFELLYHGTRGPGKSDTLLMDFAQFIGEGWGLQYKGVIFRQTFPQLEDLITKSKRWFSQMFPNAKWNGSSYKWVFDEGEELLFRQFNKSDDYWKYHGQEFQFVGWDELTNWADLDGYKSMMSCLRTTHAGIPLRCRATTNPYGPGHNAVKYHFELPAKDGIIRMRNYRLEDNVTLDHKSQDSMPNTSRLIEEGSNNNKKNSKAPHCSEMPDQKGREEKSQHGQIQGPRLARLSVKGTIHENTILLKAQPNYIAQLMEQADNPAKMAAWLEGSWDIVAGGMFDDVWDLKINVLPRFPVPYNWRLDRSFDWGSSAPFSVGWWAESDGSDFQDSEGRWRSSVRGDLFRVAEWYGWNGQPNKGCKMLAVDVAKGIRERELVLFPSRKVRAGPADSSIFTVENGSSIGVDMQKRVRMDDGSLLPGVSWTRADKRPGSRKKGWEVMRKMMRDAGPSKTGLREKPGLFVMDNCAQFIRTVPVLSRCEKDPDDVNTDSEDHIGDEVRYRVSSSGSRVSSSRIGGFF